MIITLKHTAVALHPNHCQPVNHFNCEVYQLCRGHKITACSNTPELWRHKQFDLVKIEQFIQIIGRYKNKSDDNVSYASFSVTVALQQQIYCCWMSERDLHKVLLWTVLVISGVRLWACCEQCVQFELYPTQPATQQQIICDQYFIRALSHLFFFFQQQTFVRCHRGEAESREHSEGVCVCFCVCAFRREVYF